MAKLKTVKEVRDTVSEALEAVDNLISAEKNEIKKLKQEAETHENNPDKYVGFVYKINSAEKTVKGLTYVKGLYQDYLEGKEFDKNKRNFLRKAAIFYNAVMSSDYKPSEETKRLNKEKFEEFQDGFNKGIEFAEKRLEAKNKKT